MLPRDAILFPASRRHSLVQRLWPGAARLDCLKPVAGSRQPSLFAVTMTITHRKRQHQPDEFLCMIPSVNIDQL
jgi:hypothetical protein